LIRAGPGWLAKSADVRVGPRSQTTCPVGTTNEAINARVPCRMYSCSRFSGCPGRAGRVGALRSRICVPAFSSVEMTNSPCRYSIGERTYGSPMAAAFGPKSGSWLFRQYTLRCGWRSASWRIRWMVERRMASSACRLTNSRAGSSRGQRVAGQSCSAVRSLARVRTSSRSPGGEDRRAAGSGGVLESGQAVSDEAGLPQGDGVPAAPQFGGDGAVGRRIVPGHAEDDATAEGAGLGRGRRPRQSLESFAKFGTQADDRGGRDGHWPDPVFWSRTTESPGYAVDAVGLTGARPAASNRDANTAGATYPSELCGRSWLYARRCSAKITSASARLPNTSRFSSSSRSRLLNDSQ
jgi:hypothetical protein